MRISLSLSCSLPTPLIYLFDTYLDAWSSDYTLCDASWMTHRGLFRIENLICSVKCHSHFLLTNPNVEIQLSVLPTKHKLSLVMSETAVPHYCRMHNTCAYLMFCKIDTKYIYLYPKYVRVISSSPGKCSAYETRNLFSVSTISQKARHT